MRLAPESSAGPLTHLDTYSGVDVVQIGISRKLLNVLSRLARRSPRLAPNYSAHLSKARGTRLQSSGQELPSRTPWSAHRLRLACLGYQEARPQASSSANWHLFFMHFYRHWECTNGLCGELVHVCAPLKMSSGFLSVYVDSKGRVPDF